MKILFLSLILISSISFAQTEQLSASAHIGYSMSNLLYNGGSTNIKGAYNAGIEIRKQISEKGFFFQTGIRWNEYAFRNHTIIFISNSEHYGGITVPYENTSFYLTIPLITTYKFKKSFPGITLSAGPQMSFYLFSKTIINAEKRFYNAGNTIPNLGFHAAIGYEKNIGDNWIIGADIYSNTNFPIHSYFTHESAYNFGIGLNGRYLLKKND